MSYSEDQLLPLSALNHYIYCRRRCALIHIEQAWSENRFTAEGRLMHEKVHESEAESRGNVRVARGLRLRSLQLGLIGMADVVEFHAVTHNDQRLTIPRPVEYKRGRPKPDNCDKVQLCAQAICLEEMLNVEVNTGDIFYGKTRRRQEVQLDKDLRQLCAQTAEQLHHLVNSGVIPPATYMAKCKSCSLFSICMPSFNKSISVEKYLQKALST